MTARVPPCTAGRTRHKWTRCPWGVQENPGVQGIGGAAILIGEYCPHCGCQRRMVIGDVDRPSRNHGWRYEAGSEGEA